MNAYELAEHLEKANYVGAYKAANMLRELATEKAELEKCIEDCYIVQKKQADRIAELDDDLEQAINQRSAYHGWADYLAEAIACHFDCDIGEHSNLNNPWSNALACIESPPPTPQTKSLSDEEITDVFVTCLLPDGEFDEHEFARAIEAKVRGEK